MVWQVVKVEEVSNYSDDSVTDGEDLDKVRLRIGFVLSLPFIKKKKIIMYTYILSGIY